MRALSLWLVLAHSRDAGARPITIGHVAVSNDLVGSEGLPETHSRLNTAERTVFDGTDLKDNHSADNRL